jgi:hypothetical protein
VIGRFDMARRHRLRQLKKAAGFIEYSAEGRKSAGRLNDIEQVAKFTGRAIDPSAGWATGCVPFETYPHRPTASISDIANNPVPTLPLPGGQILAANGFSIVGEQERQANDVVCHGASPQS